MVETLPVVETVETVETGPTDAVVLSIEKALWFLRAIHRAPSWGEAMTNDRHSRERRSRLSNRALTLALWSPWCQTYGR